MTSSNGCIFALLVLCAGNSSVTGEFPSQRPVTWSFDVFFYLRLNKRLSNQSRRPWFETPSRSFWRHCNDLTHSGMVTTKCVHQMGPYLNKCWLIINKNPHRVVFLTESPYNLCAFILSSFGHAGGNWSLPDKMATQITDDNLTCYFASFFSISFHSQWKVRHLHRTHNTYVCNFQHIQSRWKYNYIKAKNHRRCYAALT